MLTVSVDLNHRLVALPLGVKEGSAHRSADADVEGQRHHHGAGLLSQLGRVVGRAVVDHEDVCVWTVLTDFGDDVGD